MAIGKKSCPVVLTADVFRTETGELRVSRTNQAVNLDFKDPSNNWTLHLVIHRDSSGAPLVEQASGAVVTRATLPNDRIRTTEIVGLVKSTPGLDMREFAEVELNCSKVAVVAAKR